MSQKADDFKARLIERYGSEALAARALASAMLATSTAERQVMKRWNVPACGKDSHGAPCARPVHHDGACLNETERTEGEDLLRRALEKTGGK